MKILILGAGEVGYYLAERLSQEEHDVSVIDYDPVAIERITTNLDLVAINDVCMNVSSLQRLGIREADVVIAVTRIDEINLVASLLAKDFGVAHTIARVRNIPAHQRHLFPFHKLGVDKVINPEQAAANAIIKLTRTGRDISNIMEFAKGQLQLILLDISQNKHFIGKKMQELNKLRSQNSFLIISVVRKGKTYIPRGDFYLDSGDKIYLMLKKQDFRKTLKSLGVPLVKNKKIMIMGGEEIGYLVASELEKKLVGIKLIEEDRERCRQLAGRLDKALVLNGDATDIKLLLQENIDRIDIFIAASNDDRANLLAGLLAKNNGAKKIISVIRRPDYISLVPELGIDNVISPRVSVANEILSYVRSGKVFSVTTLADTEAEIIEQEVVKDCLLTSDKLKELDLPGNILVGAVIKGDEAIIPSGEDRLEIGERVVIFSTGRSVKQVEQLFK